MLVSMKNSSHMISLIDLNSYIHTLLFNNSHAFIGCTTVVSLGNPGTHIKLRAK